MVSFMEIFQLLFCCVLTVNFAVAGLEAAQCDRIKKGPDIRFPFWLKHEEPVPHHSRYASGFELYCTEKSQIVFELPRAVKLLVKNIDYKAQRIEVHYPDDCWWKQLQNLNLSASPFQFKQTHSYYRLNLSNYTLFNCSSEDTSLYGTSRVPCLSTRGSQVLAISSDHTDSDLLNCSKLKDTSEIPYEMTYNKGSFQFGWSKPKCSDCEEQGKGCRWKNNNTQNQTECFDIPRQHYGQWRKWEEKVIVSGSILGSVLFVLIVFGLYHLYNSDKMAKESQLKIEKFLEDYRALKPSRYSYVDIKKITNQFKDKLGQGGYGTVFKGRLSNDVLVAVKVLDNFKGNGEEFINEVGSMGRIHHVNVTRLVGFCADGSTRALVYEYLPNESLEKFIYGTKTKGEQNRFFSWEKLQDIALGIAKGIEYMHQGCEQRILHFDIKPHNILLDSNFNPKISDFGLAKLCSKEQSAVSMTAARGTMGYIAPEVLSRNFGNVSYKSDVYSFGMLLLEMVGGRKNIDVAVENASQVYFPEWAYKRLDKGEGIGISIEDAEHEEIAKKLTIVGLWCIQWYPVDRPSMKVVVQMLEGEGNNLPVPPNPFASADTMEMGSQRPKKPFNRELEAIDESE